MTKADRDRLVVENDRLAGWYVRRLAARSPSDPAYDDLVQAARLGLIEAARRYDPARGGFSSYAVWWMGRYVNDACREAYVIRLRRSTRDAPVPSFSDPEQLEAIGVVDDGLDRRIDATRIRGLLCELSERERALIEQRWLSVDEVTLREVGERLGCTREGARYIELRAFGKLRRLLTLKLSRAARRRRASFVERRTRRKPHSPAARI